MRTNSLMSICLAGALFAACNGEVEEKLKTVYKEVPTESSAATSREADTYKVTKKYGALKVKAGTVSGESKVKPWSSWWYPLNEKTLFYRTDGSASTLEKYDFYAEKVSDKPSEAALYEERNLYQPNEVGWAGLCHAWAIASVLHPEPVKTKHIGGVKWTVGDQKALLLKTYGGASGIRDIMFGQRFNGNRNDDYDDIYPDQFHKLLEDHLVEKQKPALMDYDPRFPVWTVPIYKAKFIIEKRDEKSALVSAWITFASPHVDDLNHVGAKRVVKDYKYILEGKWKNGTLAVENGEWIGKSKKDHPDYLMAFPESVQRKSANKEIDISLVDSITR